MSKWIRICQECGNKQEDKKPDNPDAATAYLNRRCKNCSSPALDYGSQQND